MKVLETFRVPTRETAYMDLISGRVQYGQTCVKGSYTLPASNPGHRVNLGKRIPRYLCSTVRNKLVG